MSTTPKGRPTPKAPQNQPPAKRGPATTPDFETREIERLMSMTPGQRKRDEARRRYLAFRAQTRPFRRAFGGDLRDRLRLASTTRLSLARDSVTVARIVETLGGVEDVRTIAQRAELPQGRVRFALRLLAESAGAVS